MAGEGNDGVGGLAQQGGNASVPSTGGLPGSTGVGGEQTTNGGSRSNESRGSDKGENGEGSGSAFDEKKPYQHSSQEDTAVDKATTDSHNEESLPRRKREADEDDDSYDDDDDDDDDEFEAEPPEDDGVPPLADEAGAGMQALEIELSRTQSRNRPASTHSRHAKVPTVTPRSKRRGLFGRFALLPEVDQPYLYTRRTKWLITTVIALSAAGGPMGSSLFYPALSDMAADLHTTETVVNLTVALYMLAMSIFPLWWSSFSETFGRRTVYIASFSLFVLFSALSAISNSIGMLIPMRILGGGASASVQAVGAGTLADIWEPHERGRAMGIFYLGPLAGPLFSPIIGGALSQRWGWQSTMWFMTGFGALVLLMLFFGLPETLVRRPPQPASSAPLPTTATTNKDNSRIADPENDAVDGGDTALTPALTRMTTAQSVRAHTQKLVSFLMHAFVHPLSVLLYLKFPPIVLTVVYGAVTFGALFVINVSIQSVYSRPPYNFGELIVGLMYIPGGLGYIAASLLGGRWIDNIMAREARKAGRYDADGKLQYLPEDRMRENAWLSASLFPAAMIWYGWTAQKGVFWLAPALATFCFGVGSMLVFGCVTTMLTEFMPRRSSGGIALNNFLRNIFSCVGAVVTQPLISAMGVGWLCTMVALIAFLIGNACIWALRRYGPRWRTMMDEELSKM